jgi:hypothetical protein
MKIGDFVLVTRMPWKARLTVLVLGTVICGSCGHDDAPGQGADGGPDGSGDDSASHPTYTVALGTSACDDLSSAEVLKLGPSTHATSFMDLPFPFPLFGETSTRFVIAEQGQVFLGGFLFPANGGEPQEPPNVVIPNGWVAPFWDSRITYLANDRGDVRVLRMGSGADERFVIGYNDFTLLFPSDVVLNPDVHLSFQLALLRQQQAIEFRYCRLDPGPNPSQALQDRVLGAAAEIGLESGDGTSGVSYSFQRPLVSAGLSIRFTPAP